MDGKPVFGGRMEIHIVISSCCVAAREVEGTKNDQRGLHARESYVLSCSPSPSVKLINIDSCSEKGSPSSSVCSQMFKDLQM